MANQVNPSVTNPTIADVYQDIRSRKLILRPDFQRKFVWTHEHQEEFIDTILKGLPFPEIYVCQGDIDTMKLTTTQHVIDGQQRLTTIQRYIEGSQEQPLHKVDPFKGLDEGRKKEFLSYKVVFRDIGEVDDATIREIFRRINLTKFKLEDVEIHNAVYDGEFIQAAKDILNNVAIKEYGVFHESEFTRMADLHFVLLVMSTIENGGYFPQDNEVENFISDNNDEYKNKQHAKALLLKTFACIDDLNLPPDSIWFRKSNFFTMVVEFARHDANVPDTARESLLELQENILNARLTPTTKFGRYYGYMYTGTNGRKARVERASVFNSAVFGESGADDSSGSEEIKL